MPLRALCSHTHHYPKTPRLQISMSPRHTPTPLPPSFSNRLSSHPTCQNQADLPLPMPLSTNPTYRWNHATLYHLDSQLHHSPHVHDNLYSTTYFFYTNAPGRITPLLKSSRSSLQTRQSVTGETRLR